ncbi:unnamed protein product, partial [Notodromas monacha]
NSAKPPAEPAKPAVKPAKPDPEKPAAKPEKPLKPAKPAKPAKPVEEEAEAGGEKEEPVAKEPGRPQQHPFLRPDTIYSAGDRKPSRVWVSRVRVSRPKLQRRPGLAHARPGLGVDVQLRVPATCRITATSGVPQATLLDHSYGQWYLRGLRWPQHEYLLRHTRAAAVLESRVRCPSSTSGVPTDCWVPREGRVPVFESRAA